MTEQELQDKFVARMREIIEATNSDGYRHARRLIAEALEEYDYWREVVENAA